jgi:hypothetical protein
MELGEHDMVEVLRTHPTLAQFARTSEEANTLTAIPGESGRTPRKGVVPSASRDAVARGEREDEV